MAAAGTLDLPSLYTFVNAGISPIEPLTTSSNGVASFPLPIPESPLLSGSSVSLQAAILDSTASLGLSLSNAVVCVLY